MPRHSRKRRWYHWIIKRRSDQQERAVNGHAESIDAAKLAKAEAERRYRRLVEMGGAVKEAKEGSANIQRRNHFSETIENLLRDGARRRARGL